MIFCCFLFVLRQLAVAEGDVDALFLLSPLLSLSLAFSPPSFLFVSRSDT